MIRVRLIILIVLFALVHLGDKQLIAQDVTQSAKLEPAEDTECEKFLRQMVAEEHFSDVALVMQGKRVLHAQGYGPANEKEGNLIATVFHIASITKQFTAAAILQLVELEKLNLDHSINDYLPKKYQSSHWDAVTCRHLLSHSSGIEDYAVVRDYYDVVDGFCLGETVDGMIREAMGKPLRFDPGSKFEYSNIGYTLLGEIIEAQTGTTYQEYLKGKIFRPIGMHNTRVHIPGHVPAKGEAAGFRWDENLRKHVKDDVVSLPVTAPDGGMTTTLEDFIKWIRIYTDRESAILKKASVSQIMEKQIKTKFKDANGGEVGYGFGLFVGKDLLSHPGYIVGFRSHFILDTKKGITVVVFTNNTANNPRRIARGLLKIVDSRIEKRP